MNSLKLWLQGIYLSPSLTFPLLSTYLRRIGSRAGSISSPTFSSNTHLPNWMASSKFLSRLGSLVFTASKLSLPISSTAKFLTNLLAQFQGSIIRGHLLDLNMMIAFSIERLSLGSVAAVQTFVLTGSSRRFFMVMPSQKSIFKATIFSLQMLSMSCLNCAVKAPAYATMPAPMRQLPISKPYS